MKVKKCINFLCAILLGLTVINEFRINTIKNDLNTLGNKLCYVISSQMGVDDKVISYLEEHDKTAKLTYASNQLLSKGEVFYFELHKKITTFLKEEEVVIYKNVILGAYSIV